MTIQNENYRMLEPYIKTVEPAGYLTSKFSVPMGGMHDNEKIAIDLQDDADDVATPRSAKGWNYNERSGFSGKEWEPPVYKEAFAIAASDLMKGRAIGENPFVTPVLGTRAQAELNRMAIKLQNKIQNALELQASQIFTTGAMTLTDSAGVTRYSQTFGAKSTHFPVAGTTWATTATADPLGEIAALGRVIRADSGRIINRVTMNSVTYQLMIATDSFKAAMNDNYRMWFGSLDQQPLGVDTRGGIRMGRIMAGEFVVDVYTYDKTYKNPNGGAATYYIPSYRYVVESSGAPMYATFGGLANFGTDGRGDRYFARLNNAMALNDLSIVTWVENDGTAVNIGCGSRPLLIPVAIHSFGCGKTTTS